MSSRITILVLTVLLIVSFGFSSFAFPPRHAVAQSSGSGSCIIGVAAGIASAIANEFVSVPSEDVPGSTASWTTAGSTVGECIYNLVIVPMLRAMIRGFLQQMTERTINWINGTGNPNGQRSFVPNIAVHLQGVGDSAANAFLNQLTSGLRSPFDIAITASLRNGYLQQTSMAGFFSQYRSTLSQYSPNVNSFLSGDWSQGGARAWFALTTQPQNNPYSLYQAAARQLSVSVTDAQTNRRQDLVQSGGFLSFCPSDSTRNTESGANPQAQCTNPDGTPAQATTPGSVIMSYLQANVNSGIGQLVAAQDLDAALGQIVAALASRVLSSTGLFSSGSGPGTTGPRPGSGNENALALAQTVLSQVSAYKTAWTSIKDAANGAKTSLQMLTTYCSAELALGAIGQTLITAGDVQTALSTAVNPLVQEAERAFQTASTTRSFALQVQAAASSGNANPVQLSSDVTRLASMPPTLGQVAQAEQDARATGRASASPSGTLTVTGGTHTDRMNLIKANADALAPRCAGYTGLTGNVLDGGNLPNLYGSATVSQLERVFTSTANQKICFNANLNPQDVGNVRSFFWGTDSTMYVGGNITYWISQTFGGPALPGYEETRAFTYTSTMDFTVPAAGTYYWCLNPDTTGNKVHVELMVGSSYSGG